MTDFEPQHEQPHLGKEDADLLRRLVQLGQKHLFRTWAPPGTDTDRKRGFCAQVRVIDSTYPGGLGAYLENAGRLLAAARRGDNPYAGYQPEVPPGRRLTFASAPFLEAEARGLSAANRVAYVLVAGGLGERLGFQGIKVGLPAETATGRTFLERYIRHILSLEAEANRHSGETRLAALAIMTSDDTDQPTRELLADHCFGMKDRVFVLKQNKVPALLDDSPALAPAENDPYLLATKPHGHGDVHALLHRAGLIEQWRAAGLQWVVFFQDTNALAFHVVPAAIGSSIIEDLEVNSVAIPRRPGEAVGGIVRLSSGDRALTINVEYNQLDALLRAAGHQDEAAEEAAGDGESAYPGNTNVLVFALEPYAKTLQRTQGAVPEFVNPKYADAGRTRFSTPTRLECMMQDYPQLLGASARVGFTKFDRDVCFSPVKNNLETALIKHQQGLPLESAGSGEADLYAMGRRLLSLAGAEVATGAPSHLGGVALNLFPVVILDPALVMPSSPTWHASNVRVSARSTLILELERVSLEDVTLEGALVVRAVPGARVTLRGLAVTNRGWEAIPHSGERRADPLAVRGFELLRHETRVITFHQPGDHVWPATKAPPHGVVSDVTIPGGDPGPLSH